jgi:L-fuculose-phosphate aldolase
MNEEQIKLSQKICDAGRELLAKGLVARSWGNISLRYQKNYMLITPSGRTYEDLQPQDIVLVNLDTLKYDGSLKPSSEYALHAEIYRQRKDIEAVIHTHQMNASTVAAARREVPPILDDMAQIIGPTVRVADYALPGTKKIVKATIKALKGRKAALLANHGAICIGRNLEEAFIVSEILEKACRVFIEAEFLGGAKSISKFEAHLMHQYYLRKYSKQADPEQARIKK